MDDFGRYMDIIDRANRAHLLATRVSDARYFFRSLAPDRRGAFRIAFGGRERCEPDYEVTRSSFGFCVLEYVIAGIGELVLNGQKHALGRGVLFAYDRGTGCEIRTTRGHPMVKYFLCLDGRGAEARLASAGLGSGTVKTLPPRLSVSSLWDDLIREGQSGDAHASEICAATAQLLLVKIKAELGRVGVHREQSALSFERAKLLIDANADKWTTLEEVAAALHMQPATVCRLFRRYQGESPYRYLLRTKMNLAAGYLLENGGLVKDAAVRVGFADPLHFSRVFRAMLGVAPSRVLPKTPQRSMTS